MIRRVACPKKHALTVDLDSMPPPSFPIVCPVCGALVLRDRAELDRLTGEADTDVHLRPALGTIGDYELVASIGQGGMGSLFKAVHKTLGRFVALRVDRGSGDPEHSARRLKRSKEAAGLSHPHWVSVLDCGEHEDGVWEAQEYMEGGDLQRQIAGPLDPCRAARVVADVAGAVHYLHERGYVHRNVKPGKILFSAAGTAKLSGLDLALRLGDDAGSEFEGIVGSPRSMAPEQWRGDRKAIGPSTDVFGLGAVLFETLTGRPALAGASIQDLMRSATSADKLVSLQSFPPEVPISMREICRRCLEKDPSRRFSSAAALADALAKSLAEPLAESTGTARPGSVGAAPQATPRTPAPAAVAPSASPQWGSPRQRPDRRRDRDDDDDRSRPQAAPAPPTRSGWFGRLWTPLARSVRWLGFRRGDLVDASVFAPPTVGPKARFMVQVFAHLPEDADDARKAARRFDPLARHRGVQTLEMEVDRGQRLVFHLAMPGLVVDGAHASLIWRGRPASVQFEVRVPRDFSPRDVIGTVAASLDGVPVGHIKFKLTVSAAASADSAPIHAGNAARRYRHAFISYASADRPEVLKRVQMLARLRIGFFQDVLDLDPGVRWERELYRQIDRSDLFLLFWSARARESKWVLEEVRYALQRKSGDELQPPEILPIVLEGPPPPPPPDELSHLHFNDYLLYLMRPAAK